MLQGGVLAWGVEGVRGWVERGWVRSAPCLQATTSSAVPTPETGGEPFAILSSAAQRGQVTCGTNGLVLKPGEVSQCLYPL